MSPVEVEQFIRSNASSGILVDSNSILLLVVGHLGRGRIDRHRRLSEFGDDDYDLLVGLLQPFHECCYTVSVMTEVSNLAIKGSRTDAWDIYGSLKHHIDLLAERSVTTVEAAAMDEFFARV